jgi:uncharacterized membrane protein YeiH
VSLQLALDLLGIFVFAVSGGLIGVRRRLDVFGVLVLAAATGLAAASSAMFSSARRRPPRCRSGGTSR